MSGLSPRADYVTVVKELQARIEELEKAKGLVIPKCEWSICARHNRAYWTKEGCLCCRVEALEKEQDADWRKFVHLRDDNERIRVLGEELVEKEARIEALENEAATLHAALMVFEAGWSTGGYLDPLDFWDKCFPRLNDLVPPDHRSFVWAVEQEMRDRAPLRGEEEK